MGLGVKFNIPPRPTAEEALRIWRNMQRISRRAILDLGIASGDGAQRVVRILQPAISDADRLVDPTIGTLA